MKKGRESHTQDLLVRRVEESVVKRLRARAAAHGCSTEEEIRMILRASTLGSSAAIPDFREHLLAIPTGETDTFERRKDRGRHVEL